MRKKGIRILAMFLVFSMLSMLAACSGKTGQQAQSASVSSSGSAETKSEYVADNSILRVALPKNVAVLDGMECVSMGFNLAFEIFDPLTKMNASMEAQPNLALSWEQIDELTWRFELREGVVFSNGEPFNAASAASTLNYMATKTPTFKYANTWGKAWPITAEAEGDTILYVKTSAPCVKVPEMISRVGMWPEGVGNDEEFQKNPIGTGPYMLESWTLGENITLVKNPKYWGEEPVIERLSYDIVTDEDARSIAMKAGEYDFVLGVTYDEAEELQQNPGDMVLLDLESLGSQYIYFNGISENPFIQNLDFRKAMTYAIDNQGILDNILNGFVEPAVGICPELDSIAYTYAGGAYLDYDPEKAAQLAKECGYNGEEILFLYSSEQFTCDLEIAELIVSLLNEAGFNVKLEQVDSATWNANYKGSSSYDIALNSCGGTFIGDSEYYYTPVLNGVGWKWDEAEELLTKAYASGVTEELRGEYLTELMKFAWEQTPYLWASECKLLYAADSHLKNFDVLPTGGMIFEKAYFE